MQDDSCQINFDEKLLCFKEVYLGIFYAFSMKGTKIKDEKGKAISKDEAIDALKKCDLVAEWSDGDHSAKGFEYAEEFFRKELSNNIIRLKLNSSRSLNFRSEELNVDQKDIFFFKDGSRFTVSERKTP
jgi:hypothetical protein